MINNFMKVGAVEVEFCWALDHQAAPTSLLPDSRERGWQQGGWGSLQAQGQAAPLLKTISKMCVPQVSSKQVP